MNEDPDAPLYPYWRQLGEFTHYFTVIELRLFYILCAIAQVSFPIGKALFSGTRADGLISNIRRCYAARDLPLPDILDRTLKQAAVINGVRNDMIHHSTFVEREPDPDAPPRLVATNKYRYPSDRARETTVSPELLDVLQNDVLTIMAALKFVEYEITATGEPWMIETLKRLAHRPWHYKPSSLSSPPESRGQRPKRERPPKPSEE